MPRYFFQLHQGPNRLDDPYGDEFATLAEAEEHARVVAYELGRNAPASDLQNARVMVLDGDGREVFTVGLEQISESGSRSPEKRRRLH